MTLSVRRRSAPTSAGSWDAAAAAAALAVLLTEEAAAWSLLWRGRGGEEPGGGSSSRRLACASGWASERMPHRLHGGSTEIGNKNASARSRPGNRPGRPPSASPEALANKSRPPTGPQPQRPLPPPRPLSRAATASFSQPLGKRPLLNVYPSLPL